MHEKYYTQRSSGGFLMTEATGISQHGLGWFKAPGKFVYIVSSVNRKFAHIICPS
jgi:hypothetical protein